ncbi:MAG: BadF/BadG/BcrA/BcrD ATPase family protein [Myxococcota bacterium]
MTVYVGVDLGSTTSKAVVLDDQGGVLGRGITNSRSNYDVAVDIARTEAFIETRFNMLKTAVMAEKSLDDVAEKIMSALFKEFRLEQHMSQLAVLEENIFETSESDRYRKLTRALRPVLENIFEQMREGARKHFRFSRPSTEFFRDLASSDYMRLAQEAGDTVPFDTLASLFDKAILIVENRGLDLSFEANVRPAFGRIAERFDKELGERGETVRAILDGLVDADLEVGGSVGTGYGRARLPFPKEMIRSEILCHGLGAHLMFPNTATVLDIGGQDTKAIQVNDRGIVTSFQMNDRCAAGCGRYLGYIADEMNLGLHELGPLADKATHTVKINSTCTVFAGAELRDRLTMGQKREDILDGLHRAIILRAMSLLARSGGIKNELTVTGGVAKNSAAVRALKGLVLENYGEMTLNISPDSIFTGALGGAMFALRAMGEGQEAAA